MNTLELTTPHPTRLYTNTRTFRTFMHLNWLGGTETISTRCEFKCTMRTRFRFGPLYDTKLLCNSHRVRASLTGCGLAPKVRDPLRTNTIPHHNPHWRCFVSASAAQRKPEAQYCSRGFVILSNSKPHVRIVCVRFVLNLCRCRDSMHSSKHNIALHVHTSSSGKELSNAHFVLSDLVTMMHWPLM